MTLRWRGDEVQDKMRAAIIRAMNTTMELAAVDAKRNHTPGSHAAQRFESQTGALVGSIDVVDRPQGRGVNLKGRWGSQDIQYARRIELGFQGKDRLGRVFDQPAFPFLRPAAQKEYPKFPERIRREFQR